jgi:hypothetical protein
VKKSLEKFYLHVRPPFFYPIREGIVREDTGAGVHREGWYRGGYSSYTSRKLHSLSVAPMSYNIFLINSVKVLKKCIYDNT